MAKIIYLFGAGASANALPIVNQIPNRIKRMIAELPQLEEKEKFVYKSINNIVKELQDELLWLYEAIGNHASIDTLAKKLWVKGGGFNDDYYRLKFATAAYFTLEQVYNKPDQRYDTFWASMLDIRILERLPANITILSWNYDSQFEFAFKEYQIYNEITSIQSCLGMDERGDTGDCFNILKLNGSALLLEQSASDEKYRIIDPFFSAPIGKSILNYIHDVYVDGRQSKSLYCPLSFAWETVNKEPILSRIESRVKDADILVVIGYSFPFFNRAIDRKIIESMPKLKKIYFQDPTPDNIASAFKAILSSEEMAARNIGVTPITYTDQFFLPPELS